MPIQAKCPECSTIYNLADEQRGKRVRCRSCEGTFIVAAAIKPKAGAAEPAPPRKDPRLAAEPRSKPQSKPQPPPARFEVRRPAAPPAIVRRAPRPAEDDDTPPMMQEKRGKSNNVPWIIGGALAGLLILVGGIVAVVAMSGKKADAAATVAETRPDPTPVHPVSTGPANGGELSQDVLDKVMRATVYLRVTSPGGGVGQGSGFFGIAPGMVLTNAHVLGMLQPDSPRPQSIEVVLNSGQKDEKRFRARIRAVDRFSDLAVLDIGGATGVPAPLEVKPARNLRPTQEVYVVGFPLGDKLGREVSVRKSSVAALRRAAKDSDEIEKVQVQGGMDPGNSGGPVVDKNGNVVGVSVSGIVGTQINFAIPGERVHTIMNGRLSTLGIGQAFVSGAAVGLPITMGMIDPRNAIHDIALEVWTGLPGTRRPPAIAQAPAAQPGDSQRKRFPLAYRGGAASGEVMLPPLPPGQTYWYQPTWTNAVNVTHWASASPFRLKAPPLERKSVQIVYRTPVSGTNHSLSLITTSTFKIHDPDGDVIDHSMKMDSSLNERILQAGDNGYSTGVQFRSFKFSELHNKKPVPTRPRLARIANSMGAVFGSYRVDRAGNLFHSRPTLTRIHPSAREEVNDTYEQIQHALTAMSVPMPNRMVNVNESWRAQRTLPIDTPGRFEKGAMEMTFTYLGCRKRDGRDEALVSLNGQIRRLPGRSSVLGGKASGTALIDLATGQVRLAQAAVVVDMKVQFKDGESIKVICEMDVVMQRSR